MLRTVPAPPQRAADTLMTVLVVLSSLLACAIGNYYGTLDLAVRVALVLAASALLLRAFGSGSAAARYGLPALLCATVVLHIQVSLGTTEWHFGVFVTLALVMVYRSPQVLLVCAGLFVVQHVLFDRLQALGWNVYCTSEANLPRMALHASFVVVQTAVQCWIVQRLNHALRQGQELQEVVAAALAGGQVRLNVQQLPVRAPLGQGLQRLLAQLDHSVHTLHTTVEAVGRSSAQLADGSHTLAQRTDQASQALQDTHQRTSYVRQQAQAAHALAQQGQIRAQETAQASQEGLQLSSQLDERLRTLVQHTEAMSGMADTAQRLAFQTQQLALQAALPADNSADAPDSALAAVAHELQALAQRSADAAQAMQQQVQATHRSMADSAALGHAVADRMHTLHIAAQQSAQDLHALQGTAQRQQTALSAINLHMGVLDQAMAHNTALAQSSTNATTALHQQTQRALHSLQAASPAD